MNLSTLNFVLIIIGYPLVTTLLLPSNSDLENISQSITIPFRIFCLSLMILVTFLNISFKTQITASLKVLGLVWLLWIFRIFYDLYINGNTIDGAAQLWLYVLGICIPAMISITKSINKIDSKMALDWIWYSLSLILIVTLFSNQALIGNTDKELRVDGNIALNSISYGNVGTLAFILTLYRVMQTKIKSRWILLLHIIIGILSFYSVLRAGSRGPVINLFFTLFFWYFSIRKNALVGIVVVCFFILGLFIFRDFFLELLGDIAPVIESRFRDTLEGNSNDGRDVLHSKAIDAFFQSPLIGQQFGIFDGNGGYAYSHNLLLDFLMGLGLVGGGMLLYILSKAIKLLYYSIKNKDNFFWVSLILLQQLFSSMFSGTFYQDQILTALLTFVFIKYKNFSK
ncbi:hypothetical protein OF897_06325 [Chryseobacterium formosus]|uniref:O-antigen ligase n=1 Tax=Chryseobacterium formosus TaxID=1537363 RepID=A0ABT3XN23_9FLAO|nr:O-antigen ligase family protein [Chryseobacterium formosus]MCX8523533.1 hypothetical protein [Chryseobacterium formosus]